MRAKWVIGLTVISSLMIVAVSANAETKSEDVGEAVYMRGCVTCHGDDGAGAMPGK